MIPVFSIFVTTILTFFVMIYNAGFGCAIRCVVSSHATERIGESPEGIWLVPGIFSHIHSSLLDHSDLKSYQNVISPYNIRTLFSRQVMRINQTIGQIVVSSACTIKFSYFTVCRKILKIIPGLIFAQRVLFRWGYIGG